MAMPKHIDKITHFLNVDLDIYSTSNLEPLVAALGEQVYVLYSGRQRRTYEAHLELAGWPKSADAAIHRFSALIDKLPKGPRKLWDTARTRDFSIGVQAAMQPSSYDMPLARETVEAASELKARIVLTVYAPEVFKKRVRKNRRDAASDVDGREGPLHAKI